MPRPKPPSAKNPAMAPLTQGQIAEVFCVSQPLVSRWREQGCPCVEGTNAGHDRYLLSEMISWRLRRAEKKSAGASEAGNSADERYAQARAKRMESLAIREKLKLAKERGRYYNKIDVESAWRAQITDARLVLEAIPIRVALLVADPKLKVAIQDDARETVNNALLTLAKASEEIKPEDIQQETPDESRERKDDGRVRDSAN